VILVWGVVPGGTLSVLRDWVPRLAGHGAVRVVSFGPDTASLGVPTVTVGDRWSHPIRFPNVVGYVVRLVVAVTRGAPRGGLTVLMPQDALATGAAAVIAGRLLGARVALMEHGSAAAFETDRFWRERSGAGPMAALRARACRLVLRALHRLTLSRMDVALVAGEEEAAIFLSRAVDEDRLLRHRFGIDLALFHPASHAERAEARRRWGVPVSATVIVCVSRLAPEKGVGDLIAAVATLPAQAKPHLLIAGDGPLRADLERIAASAGVAATFAGGLAPDDVAAILRAADCFVYPALRGANTPYAVLEAMATGLPIVATTAPAVHRKMLADGRGVAIEPGDRDAMRAGILGLLQDPDEASVAGAAARQYVSAHHSPAQVDEAVTALVQRLWPPS
jgi:glycosyltransferase involved in cell wall biosynthesis